MLRPTTAQSSQSASSTIWLPFIPTSWSVLRLVMVIDPATKIQDRPPPARKNSRLLSVAARPSPRHFR